MGSRSTLVAAAVVLLLCGPGCSDDTTPVDQGVVDQGVADGKAADAPQGQEGGPPADLRPDQPTGPPEWKPVNGVGPRGERLSAVLLKDGRVLVTGGASTYSSPDEYYTKAYLYDPAKNVFLGAGNMATPRQYHTSHLLPDGRVLVVGGYNDSGGLSSTEIYDPKKPGASAWSKGPPLGGPRYGHAGVTLASGDVVVLGGYGKWPDVLSSIAVYQPSQGTWKLPATSLGAQRAYPGAVLLKTGKILVAAGTDGTDYHDTLETYDPATGKVEQVTAKLTYGRSFPAAARLKDGRVLIVGGRCTKFKCKVSDEIFDPVTGKVTPVSHPGGPPEHHAGALLGDGRVLITGGYDPTDAKKALIYDPAAGGSWVVAPSMSHARGRHAAATLTDGSVLVVGGSHKGAYPTTAERFYPHGAP